MAGGHGYGDDDGELRSVVCAGGKQRRERGPGEERGGAGGEGECVAPSGASSGEQVSRRWPECARARRTHALLPTGRRLKTVAAAVGWDAGVGPAGLPGTFSLSLLVFVFYFFLQLCGFIKNTKTFPKILKIIVGFV